MTITAEPTLPEPTPSHTPSPTETATPTPRPTPPPGEEVNHVLALLHDNQNPDCLLPCWWGAVPGQTYWPEISRYIYSFAQKVESFPEQSVFVAMFSVPENIDYRGKLNIGYRLNTSRIVTSISVASINIAGYDPRTMMTLYGVPDEVWLLTLDYYISDNLLPFKLIIVYQEKGISFNYYVNASVSDGIVTRCFEPGVVETERLDFFAAGPEMYLWEPGQHKAINEITRVPEAIYLPLEETTDLTPQTFYEKFTDLNQSPCIDTPASSWDWLR
jgi:hypothetical protein